MSRLTGISNISGNRNRNIHHGNFLRFIVSTTSPLFSDDVTVIVLLFIIDLGLKKLLKFYLNVCVVNISESFSPI